MCNPGFSGSIRQCQCVDRAVCNAEVMRREENKNKKKEQEAKDEFKFAHQV
jgi:hypothetical protein